jgi:hydrogenase nickel incorporation protein HypB
MTIPLYKETIMERIDLSQPVLKANQDLAQANRERLARAGVKSINLISSPGAGKTSVLEKTLAKLTSKLNIAVIEGDIQTQEDAQRVSACGVKALQIETMGGCHLDAPMIQKALDAFELENLDLLIIENVGNLVCPVDFDLGEDLKVAVLSLTEGDDKPAKYPQLFQKAGALLINKMDLAPYLDVDLERIRSTALKLNPKQKIFEISCKTGQGLDEWTDWLINWAKAG